MWTLCLTQVQKKYKRREDTEWQRKKWKKQVKIHSEKNTPKYIKSISYGDAIGMSIHFQMNIYYIPVTTRQNALCFRCAFWLFLVQSRKWLKLYSCKLQWSQNPIIQSHFSVNSYHKKEVCFGRIRIKRLAGGSEDFSLCPSEHRDPVKQPRARDVPNYWEAKRLRSALPGDSVAHSMAFCHQEFTS